MISDRVNEVAYCMRDGDIGRHVEKLGNDPAHPRCTGPTVSRLIVVSRGTALLPSPTWLKLAGKLGSILDGRSFRPLVDSV